MLLRDPSLCALSTGSRLYGPRVTCVTEMRAGALDGSASSMRGQTRARKHDEQDSKEKSSSSKPVSSEPDRTGR